MSVDFTNYTSILQARLNGVNGSTSATELLLLAKASESSIGNANVTAVNNAGATKLSEVNSAGATQLSAVNTAGTTKVSEVNGAGSTQVAAVNSAATTQLSAVNSAGSTQITAVNNAGAAWLNGSQPIPAAVVAQIRGPQGIQGPVGATFSVSGGVLTINT